MEDLETSQKAKAISVFLTIGGLVLFSGGMMLLFNNGVTPVPFQMISSSFFCWAYAASPEVMLRSVRDKSKIKYTLLSKILLIIGTIILIASPVVYYYIGA